MKKFILKHAHILSAFAVLVTTIGANRACAYHWGQVPVPVSLKKLRKF